MHDYQFVLYIFSPKDQDAFRQAFQQHYGGHASITFGPVTPDMENIAANHRTDRAVTISTSHLKGGQIDHLFSAVQAAAHDCGSAMCPVRDENGELVDVRQSRFAKWKQSLHV
ncbi:hypothetical protein IAR55_006164 [Kwoniella newhampshirensis]|uniref:EthD domain-containing protein n=1 Tax=Kwoniella newhampshirensis TaxID=1651941 RepID=A0AAW0YGC8_9TREE